MFMYEYSGNNDEEKTIQTTTIHKNNETNEKFYQKVACIRKWLILVLKAEKQLRNKNHTKDWALGCHPGDNGHVIH